jgi:hypothetical protein
MDEIEKASLEYRLAFLAFSGYQKFFPPFTINSLIFPPRVNHHR